jgi:hypothetical protein
VKELKMNHIRSVKLEQGRHGGVLFNERKFLERKINGCGIVVRERK